jgi:hypothetical protein
MITGRPADEIISLLDRREERIDVGVQDPRLHHTNICSRL